MLICFCSAKFLLEGVNIVYFSNDHNIVSSLICGGQNKPPMEFLDPFLQVSSFVYHLCYLCFVFVMLSCLLIADLLTPAGKGLTSWLACM